MVVGGVRVTEAEDGEGYWTGGDCFLKSTDTVVRRAGDSRGETPNDTVCPECMSEGTGGGGIILSSLGMMDRTPGCDG